MKYGYRPWREIKLDVLGDRESWQRDYLAIYEGAPHLDPPDTCLEVTFRPGSKRSEAEALRLAERIVDLLNSDTRSH